MNSITKNTGIVIQVLRHIGQDKTGAPRFQWLDEEVVAGTTLGDWGFAIKRANELAVIGRVTRVRMGNDLTRFAFVKV